MVVPHGKNFFKNYIKKIDFCILLMYNVNSIALSWFFGSYHKSQGQGDKKDE